MLQNVTNVVIKHLKNKTLKHTCKKCMYKEMMGFYIHVMNVNIK